MRTHGMKILSHLPAARLPAHEQADLSPAVGQALDDALSPATRRRFARAIEALHVERKRPEKGLVLDPSGRLISTRLLGEHVGIEGLSGHSDRRGLAAELVRRGESPTAIQLAGEWKGPADGLAVREGRACRGRGGDAGVRE